MNRAKVSEFLINQDDPNYGPQTGIDVGVRVLSVTVKAHPEGTANVWVGINQRATNMNLLSAGESVTYQDQRAYLDGMKLYIGFDTSQVGGKALVSIMEETDTPVC